MDDAFTDLPASGGAGASLSEGPGEASTGPTRERKAPYPVESRVASKQARNIASVFSDSDVYPPAAPGWPTLLDPSARRLAAVLPLAVLRETARALIQHGVDVAADTAAWALRGVVHDAVDTAQFRVYIYEADGIDTVDTVLEFVVSEGDKVLFHETKGAVMAALAKRFGEEAAQRVPPPERPTDHKGPSVTPADFDFGSKPAGGWPALVYDPVAEAAARKAAEEAAAAAVPADFADRVSPRLADVALRLNGAFDEERTAGLREAVVMTMGADGAARAAFAVEKCLLAPVLRALAGEGAQEGDKCEAYARTLAAKVVASLAEDEETRDALLKAGTDVAGMDVAGMLVSVATADVKLGERQLRREAVRALIALAHCDGVAARAGRVCDLLADERCQDDPQLLAAVDAFSKLLA